MRKGMRAAASLAVASLVAAGLLPREASAHCDSLDGPVVQAARKALETNTVELTLAWVLPGGEQEIRDAFARTMAVRPLGGEAKAVAERWFFETLVRVHRAGEGEPYTGLKPSGTPVSPAIVRAEEALEDGSIGELVDHLTDEASASLLESFDRVVALGDYDPADVEAGRRYVRAYTEYVHFVEALAALLTGEGGGHS